MRLEMRMVVKKKTINDMARTLFKIHDFVHSHSATIKRQKGARTKASVGMDPRRGTSVS